MAAVRLQPQQRRVPGAHGQELGFDLIILSGILWLPRGALHIHNVGYASDTEQ